MLCTVIKHQKRYTIEKAYVNINWQDITFYNHTKIF